MAQRGGTFLLRRAGREQKSGLTPGHPGDPAPEKICSDAGFCCAQFRVSPACLSPLLMGRERADCQGPFFSCALGVTRWRYVGSRRARPGQGEPSWRCSAAAGALARRDAQVVPGSRALGRELRFPACEPSRRCQQSQGGRMLRVGTGGQSSLSQPRRYQ